MMTRAQEVAIATAVRERLLAAGVELGAFT